MISPWGYISAFISVLVFSHVIVARSGDTPNNAPPSDTTMEHLALSPATGNVLYYHRQDGKIAGQTRYWNILTIQSALREGLYIEAADTDLLPSSDDDSNDWAYFPDIPPPLLADEVMKYHRGRSSDSPERDPVRTVFMEPGEIAGDQRPIWLIAAKSNLWADLGQRIEAHNSDFIMNISTLGRRPFFPPTSATEILITPNRYRRLDALRKAKTDTFAEKRPLFKGKSVHWCSDVKHSSRILFDESSGRVLTYYVFEDEKPANVDLRSIAVNYGSPRTDVQAMSQAMYEWRETAEENPEGEEGCLRYSLEFGLARNGQCLVFPESFYSEEDLENGRGPKDPPSARDPNKPDWFTFFPGMFYGGECFIWELKIWEELGNRLREQKQPYVLYTGMTYFDLNYTPIELAAIPPRAGLRGGPRAIQSHGGLEAPPPRI